MNINELADYMAGVARKKQAETKDARVDYCRGLAAGQAIAFELAAKWVRESTVKDASVEYLGYLQEHEILDPEREAYRTPARCEECDEPMTLGDLTHGLCWACDRKLAEGN